MGFSCDVGQNEAATVKLDLFYTDTFVYEIQKIDGIKLFPIEEIIHLCLFFRLYTKIFGVIYLLFKNAQQKVQFIIKNALLIVQNVYI